MEEYLNILDHFAMEAAMVVASEESDGPLALRNGEALRDGCDY